MASGKASRNWFSKPKNLALIAGCAIIAILFAMNLMYQEPIDESFLDDYDEFDSYELINQDPVVYEVSSEGNLAGYLGLTSHYGYHDGDFGGHGRHGARCPSLRPRGNAFVFQEADRRIVLQGQLRGRPHLGRVQHQHERRCHQPCDDLIERVD